MRIEYVTDKAGHKKSVIIPYKEWERLVVEMEKQRYLLGLKGALTEVDAALAGKKAVKTAREFLDEL